VFTKSTNDEFKEKFTQLNETHGSKIKSLVFDLRDNGGGILGAAIDLADSLTKQDLLLGIATTTESSYHVAPILGDGEHQITDLPISIVINSNSASSAEIFAGILQDYKRAKIIGQTQSYGKGTFQEQFLHMIDGKLAGMSITTGYIGLPLSGLYQGKGIWPDIQVTDARTNLALAEQNGAQTPPSYERDLKNYMNLTKAPNDMHIDPSYTCQIPSNLRNAFVKTMQVYSTVSQTIDMSDDPDFLCAIDQYNTQRQYSLTFKAKPIELN
jgi:C-terminal processing protease CtpA/Prc